jgi:hypothetical protein
MSFTPTTVGNRQRIKVIVASSSGNPVQWHGFYACSFSLTAVHSMDIRGVDIDRIAHSIPT